MNATTTYWEHVCRKQREELREAEVLEALYKERAEKARLKLASSTAYLNNAAKEKQT